MKRRWSLILTAVLLIGLLAGCGQSNGDVTTTGTTTGNPTTAPTVPTTPPAPEEDEVKGVEIEYDENTKLVYYADSTPAFFDQYCAKLENAGGSRAYYRDTDSLRCAAYVTGEEYTYAYYAKRTGDMRVSMGLKETFYAGECTADTGVTATPKLTIIGQPSTKNNGQGYIFTLPDGRLIIQDGGFGYTTADPDAIYTAIRTAAPDENNIVIAGWFLSHPHDDHVSAFKKFMAEHGNDENVEVERVIYNFAAPEMYDFDREDGGKEKWSQYVIDVNALAGDTAIRAHTGQVFDFGCAKVEVLFTAADLLPAENFGYVNSSSMVIRVDVAEQTILLLADSTSISCSRLEAMIDEELSSDMVQLSHHGMWAGTQSIYFYAQASVLLWPTLSVIAKDWVFDHPVMSALTYAQDVFISGTDLTTLELPYTPIGNKQTVMAELKALQ